MSKNKMYIDGPQSAPALSTDRDLSMTFHKMSALS